MSVDRQTRILLAAHAAAALFMTGVIWFTQVVHYPLMAFVSPDALAAYERANIIRTAAIVGPVMLLEALSAGLLLFRLPPGPSRRLAQLGALLLAAVWASTAFLQFPAHRAMAAGAGPELLGKLTASNWLRTFCWSARSLVALRLLTRRS